MSLILGKQFGVKPGVEISAPFDSPIATYELHQSQLNTLVGMCAKRFEFEHIQHLPKGSNVSQYRMSQGLAAHAVMDSVLSGDRRPLGTIMNDKWDQFVMPNLIEVNYDKALDEYESNVQNALHYINSNFDPLLVESEKRFRIPEIWQLSDKLNGVDERWSFVGSMDLIELDDATMTAKIVDLKFRDRTNAANNRSSSQHAMYALAAAYYGYEPTFKYVEFVRGKIIEQCVPVGEGETEWLFIKARQAIDYIQNNFYPINPVGWHCSKRYCPWWSVCRGKFETDAEEEV